VKRPNFFIVGAPKSGTTALSEYLRAHPQVYISREKELNYWNDDYTGFTQAKDEAEYLAFFEDATDQYIAVGEATVHYLRSARALPRIRAFAPDARIIVMLRNPVDLVYSWHSQMVYGLYEDEPDFARAWALQAERAAGRAIPHTCLDAKVLDYRAIGMLGEQMATLYEVFPRDQVLVILFDDFAASARDVYSQTLNFLGVPDDGRTDFPRINENKRHANPHVARFTERPPRAWTAAANLVKRTLGVQELGLLRRLRDINRVAATRPPMNLDLRSMLIDTFHDDIHRLGTLIDRDLTHWLNPAPQGTRAERRNAS